MWSCENCDFDGCYFELDSVICQRCAYSQPYPVRDLESSGGDGDKSTELDLVRNVIRIHAIILIK